MTKIENNAKKSQEKILPHQDLLMQTKDKLESEQKI